jgi:hypothetical protein
MPPAQSPVVPPDVAHHHPDHRPFIVHVGTVELTFRESPVLARRILEDAGFKPADEYGLEALSGPHGKVEHEYRADDEVPLLPEHPNYFRAIPRGGGRA